jgi:hypothetical protein
MGRDENDGDGGPVSGQGSSAPIQNAPAGMAPARSNGEEAAEFRNDMLASWTATLHG